MRDIDEKRKVVYLLGKGNKPRYVPINQTTLDNFQKYKKLYHPSGDKTSPMFYTSYHGGKNQMSDDNVARFFRKYGKQAKAICPDVPDNVHPHMFRKSRAMSLYRSGMPLSLISEWLGHNDPETTLIYYGKRKFMVSRIGKPTYFQWNLPILLTIIISSILSANP